MERFKHQSFSIRNFERFSFILENNNKDTHPVKIILSSVSHLLGFIKWTKTCLGRVQSTPGKLYTSIWVLSHIFEVDHKKNEINMLWMFYLGQVMLSKG